MSFNRWIEIFLKEKGIKDELFIVKHNSMTHFVEQDRLMEFLKKIPTEQKNKIKNTFVKIDFMNGNCLDFMNHLAEGYVQATFRH